MAKSSTRSRGLDNMQNMSHCRQYHGRTLSPLMFWVPSCMLQVRLRSTYSIRWYHLLLRMVRTRCSCVTSWYSVILHTMTWNQCHWCVISLWEWTAHWHLTSWELATWPRFSWKRRMQQATAIHKTLIVCRSPLKYMALMRSGTLYGKFRVLGLQFWMVTFLLLQRWASNYYHSACIDTSAI